MNKKVLVIGLDCLLPELIFEKYEKDLPNIRKFLKQGIHGELRSSMPPSSTNAWLSMATGKSSHSFGIYDYIYRINRSYTDIAVINSNLVKNNRIWDILSKNKKRVIVTNVPLTYPPKKINGIMVSGPLTPKKAKSTYPTEFERELEKYIGFNPRVIIPNHRLMERSELLKELYRLVGLQFKMIRYLVKNKKWDFYMSVINLTDALMHNFWRYIDKKHKKYEPNSEFKNSIKDFLKYIDEEIGNLSSLAGKDTTIIIMSDHGAKRMDGRINLNDWLIKEGYLVLRSRPKKPTSIFTADVDWRKTKAFAFGAYYASVFINVKGRDPEGCVEPGEEYNKVKKELTYKMKKILDDKGNKMNTKVLEIPEGENSPDLLVYFDDLYWGVNNSVVNDSLYSWATEKGPDDAVHSLKGFFIISGKDVKKRGNMGLKDIMDIAPTILKIMDISIPSDIEGKPIEI